MTANHQIVKCKFPNTVSVGEECINFTNVIFFDPYILPHITYEFVYKMKFFLFLALKKFNYKIVVTIVSRKLKTHVHAKKFWKQKVGLFLC